MELSRGLLKKFAKITNDSAVKMNTWSTIYGTAVVIEDKADDDLDTYEEVEEGTSSDDIQPATVKKKYVRIDGSNILTPISEASDIQNGDRVMVTIQNHVATVIGNITCPPSARTAIELEPILTAAVANIGILQANRITTSYLEANYAKINQLEAVKAQIGVVEANQITTKYLETSYAQIDLANIKDGSITTAMIGTGVVNTAQIADSSITDAKIVGLTASKITAGILDAGTIEVINLNAANITVGTINGQQIAPGAIDMSKLSGDLSESITNAANTAGIAQTTADGKNTVFYQGTAPSTSGRKINDTWFNTSDSNRMYYWNGSSWTARQFGTNAIADAAIQNAKIGNLDASKITTGTLNAARIGALSISAAHLASNSVTTGKISANAITSEKIASNAVTADKIVAGSITAEKLAAKSVTANELASNAVTTDKLTASSVTADKISANAVTAAKIASNAVTTEKLAAGAVTAAKINVTDLFSQNITATNLHITGNSSFEGEMLATKFTVNQKIGTNGVLDISADESFSICTYYRMIEDGFVDFRISIGEILLSSGRTVSIDTTEACIFGSDNVSIRTNGYIGMDANGAISINSDDSVTIKGYKIEDTGWENCTILSGFESYSAYSVPRVRRIGRIVSLQGCMKPISQITASASETYMFTIPAGFRPGRLLNLIQHGSGTNKWLMKVNTDGKVSVSRYSNGTSYANIPAGSWLNCFETWMLD